MSIREEFKKKCENCEIKDWNLDVIKKSNMCHKCYIKYLESRIESMQEVIEAVDEWRINLRCNY